MFWNTRIAESKATLYLHVKHIDQDAKNTIDHTNLSITGIWHNAARQISWLIYQDLRPRKVNYAFIYSSTSTLRGAIRQIVTIVHSENTGSIANGTTRSLKSSEKSTLTQFTYLWVGVKYDFKKF